VAAAGAAPAPGSILQLRFAAALECIKTRGFGFRLRDGPGKALEAGANKRVVAAASLRTGPTGLLVVEVAGAASGPGRVRGAEQLPAAPLRRALRSSVPRIQPSPRALCCDACRRGAASYDTHRRPLAAAPPHPAPLAPPQNPKRHLWKLSRSAQELYMHLRARQAEAGSAAEEAAEEEGGEVGEGEGEDAGASKSAVRVTLEAQVVLAEVVAGEEGGAQVWQLRDVAALPALVEAAKGARPEVAPGRVGARL
jgi:hypothetical protein